MNCQDFEKVLNDIARREMLEAGTRSEALAHAEACEQCAVRRDDELELTAGLNGLAASMSQLQAPARVETALLKAMRERNQNVLPFERKEVVVVPGPAKSYWQWRSAAGIAAGLALMVLTFAIFNMREKQSPSKTVAGLSARPLEQAAATPPSVGLIDDEPVPEAPPLTAGVGLPIRPTNAVMRTSGGSRTSVRDEARSANPSGISSAAAAEANEKSDIATDFFPISYGSDLSNIESGRVVRVELPRATMAQFGLPVNAERAAEPVKADVLIGEDGLAQAIRFVR